MTRRARVVAACIAVVLVCAGVALLIAVRGQHAEGEISSAAPARSASSQPAPSPTPSLSPTPSPAAVSPAPSPKPPLGPRPIQRPPLTVLNNSTISGLGADAAARFRAAGWTIAEVGSLGGRYRYTTVHYGPGQIDAARALMRQFPAITVMEPRSRYPLLPGEGLTVVVTRDFA